MAKEVAGNLEEADKSGILARYRIICVSYRNPGDVDAFYDVVELLPLRGGEDGGEVNILKRWGVPDKSEEM